MYIPLLQVQSLDSQILFLSFAISSDMFGHDSSSLSHCNEARKSCSIIQPCRAVGDAWHAGRSAVVRVKRALIAFSTSKLQTWTFFFLWLFISSVIFGKLVFIAWGYNKLEPLEPNDANCLALGTEVVDPGPGVLDYSSTFMLTRCCQAPHGFISLQLSLYNTYILYIHINTSIHPSVHTYIYI